MSTKDTPGQSGKKPDKSFDEDYLALLQMADQKYPTREDSSRDIYSSSTTRRDASERTGRPSRTEPSAARTSGEDVFVRRKPADTRRPETDDVYVSRKRSRQPTGEFYMDIDSGRTDPPRRTVKRPTDEEISDFEVKHGIRKPKKKKNKGLRVFLAVVALLLAVVLGIGGYGVSVANSVVGKLTKATEITHIASADSLVHTKDVRNILLIGLDKEQGGASRSDSIIIASVNRVTGKIILTSILRDSHVEVPGYDESKINSAYAWGGADLLVQTIETNFGIYIDDYATVNYAMFTKLVNGLGGIDIEVTEAEANYINYEHEYKGATPPDTFKSGKSVHLNGYQALWYARIRKLDSDFMRTYRQRKVLKAIFSNVKAQLSPAGLPGLIKTAESVAPYVETTLTKTECYSLAAMLLKCVAKNGLDMEKLMLSQKIPFEDTWSYSDEWDGSSVALDIEENKALLYASIYEGKTVEAETTE